MSRQNPMRSERSQAREPEEADVAVAPPLARGRQQTRALPGRGRRPASPGYRSHLAAAAPELRIDRRWLMPTWRLIGLARQNKAVFHSVLGISWFDGIAYIAEDIGDDDAPIVYRLYLRGPRQGHLVPLHAWCDPAAELRAKIAALAPTLEPAPPTAREAP